MSAGPGGVGGFLAALQKLPPDAGLTFRGLAAGAAAPTTGVTDGLMASSRDPRVATENFRVRAVVALLNRTGREIAALSRFPEEAEVVVLPGGSWRALGAVEVEGVTVHVMEELDPAGGSGRPASWGATTADVTAAVGHALAAARAQGPVPVTSPGKFAGAWAASAPPPPPPPPSA